MKSSKGRIGPPLFHAEGRYAGAMNLDIVLPRVLAAPADARMPALERWIARGDAGTLAAGSLGGVLALQYGLADSVPAAAIAHAAGGREGGFAPNLIADPVHLEVGQVAAVLHDASALAITPDESRALTRDLTRLFAGDGIEFR